MLSDDAAATDGLVDWLADAAAVEDDVLNVELLDEVLDDELEVVVELESLVVDASLLAAEVAATVAADSTDGSIEVTSV